LPEAFTLIEYFQHAFCACAIKTGVSAPYGCQRLRHRACVQARFMRAASAQRGVARIAPLRQVHFGAPDACRFAATSIRACSFCLLADARSVLLISCVH